MTIASHALLASLALASWAAAGCTRIPVPQMILPTQACHPLEAAAHQRVETPAAPASAPRIVALLGFGGTPAAHREVPDAIAHQLEHRGFSTRTITLDPADASSPAGCTHAPDIARCLATIGAWLAQRKEANVDFVLYGRYDAGRPMIATFVVHDVAANRGALSLDMMIVDGDVIGPAVLPSALARALADHVTPPPPITAAERVILATLDEPLHYKVVRLRELAPGARLTWRNDDVAVQMRWTDVAEYLRRVGSPRLRAVISSAPDIAGADVVVSQWTDVRADPRMIARQRWLRKRWLRHQVETSRCPRDPDRPTQCLATDEEMNALVATMIDHGRARVFRCGAAPATTLTRAYDEPDDDRPPMRHYMDARGIVLSAQK